MMKMFKKKKKDRTDKKWDYYNNKMASLLADDWEVKEDSEWYTVLKKDESTWGGHFLILFILPIVGNIIYEYAMTKKKKILKPIK